LFFLGYFPFQAPGTRLAERYSIRWMIFCGLIGWGVLACATGLIHSLGLLYADRLLLGVVESAVMPALVLLLSRWFTADERARANTILILGNPVTMLWMSVVSGYLAQAAGWRTMFVVEGAPSILWAFVWLAFAADRPSRGRWVDPARARALEAAIADEQHAIKPMASYAALARSPALLLFSIQFLLWSVGAYGFVLWLPVMLKHNQIGLGEIGWLAAAPYAAAIMLMCLGSFASDRLRARKIMIWPFLLTAAIAFYGSYLTAGLHYWVSYGLLVVAGACTYAPYGTFFASITEVLPRNVLGAGVAIINSAGALGSFGGTYLVGLINGLGHGPGLSYLLIAAALLLASTTTIALPMSGGAAKNR
jgi:MFS family permease